MSNRITIDELKSYLWESAVFLRTNIDAGAYKQYIFPLLFFKRICDVYDEETQKAIVEYGEDIDLYPEEELHTFLVPKGHHWNDVREVTEDVGAAIVAAFREIEKVNGEKMMGVFGDGAWTNKNRLPDRLLKDLLEHFSSKTLSLANCPEDELGQGYEYLIKQFADDSGHTAQEFYTNRTVVHLMTEMLKPQSGESVYDPTCGSAGMLISCIAYLKAQGKEWRNLHLYGQEINQLTSAIGRMNLFLHGIEDFHIVNDDTLRNPAFIERGTLKQFDICLANPPYSIKQWDRAAFETDKYGRNLYGTPPQARADYAFFQHIIASLKPNTGRCAILFPHGVLNRNEEADIRRNMIQADLIEAVIGLGRHLFYNSGLESCIIICRKNKPLARRGKILFIEAEKYLHKVQSQSYLFPEDIAAIVNAYEADTDISGLSRTVPISEIMDNNGNLNIKLYVKNKESIEPDAADITEYIEQLIENSDNMREAVAAICPEEYANETGYWGSATLPEYDKSTWKTVKLKDIAWEYAERVDEPSQSEYEWYIGSDCIDGFDFRIPRRTPTEKVHSSQKAFKAGDYLLVRRSLYGSDFRERAPRADFDGVCSADILTIREKEGVIANGYLIAVLYSKKLWDFVVSESTGSLTRRIKWKQLAELEILLPPYDIQEKISKILWALYDTKIAYQRLLQQTDDLVKSQFIEMFGEGNASERYIPLKDCCADISGGKTPSMSHPEYYGGSIPFVKSGDVKSTAVSSGALWLTDDALEKAGIKLVPKDSVIVVIRSAALRHEFNIAVAQNPIVINQDLKALQPKSEFLPLYLLWAIKSREDMLLSKVQTVLTSHIEMTDLVALPVMVVSIERQKLFCEFVEQADKSKFEIKQAIENITTLIKVMLQ